MDGVIRISRCVDDGRTYRETTVSADDNRIGEGRGVDLDGAADRLAPRNLAVAELEAPMRFASLAFELRSVGVAERQRRAVIIALVAAIWRLRRRSSSSAVS